MQFLINGCGRKGAMLLKGFVSEFKTDYVKSFYILLLPLLDFLMH